jgi:N,N'-diacetylchitobiose transport system substrate-binding protein
MNIKRTLSPALAIGLAIAGCTSAASPVPSPTATAGSPSQAPSASASIEPTTLTVWLMNGSTGPEPSEIVADLNAEYEAAHPGVTVQYQVQQWDGIVDKLTTALASNTPPDVIEMGNTQTAKFAAAGALMDLTDKRQELGGGTSADSSSPDELWLGGLNDSSMWDGKLFAVPFYAGNRVMVYNTEQFEAAGLDPASLTSKAKLIDAAKKLQTENADVDDYSGFYIPGQNWYALMSFVWDNGGEIAVEDGGAWKGALSTTEAQAGIQDYVDYYNAGSTGPKDNDEQNPEQATVIANGKAGMILANLWEVGTAETRNADIKGKLGVFPIPSRTEGKTAPVFLGGSNLGVPSTSKNQALALDWVKLMAGEKYQKLLIGVGDIPNSKDLAENATGENENLHVAAAAAAAGSKVTPQSPNWAAVEAGANPLKDMLTQILTEQASIADAAKAADDEIAARMNTAP